MEPKFPGGPHTILHNIWLFFQLIEIKFKPENGKAVDEITITKEELLRFFPEFRGKI